LTKFSSNNIKISIKPKKKNFGTPEEKRKFVEDYCKKKKTELCKNWMLKSSCKFGDKVNIQKI
jgi:butyrate response factor 1